jgi:serine/threonine protein kinase
MGESRWAILSMSLTGPRWHADIKPDNILSVQGKFKLADPGFAKFVRKTENVPCISVHGGTETYGNSSSNVQVSLLPLVVNI